MLKLLMVFLYYHQRMRLKRSKGSTIPFGFKLADDDNKYIESVQSELDALEEAKEYLNNCSYREVARWLTQKTNRPITHVGLRKIVNNRWTTSHHLNQNKILEEKEESHKANESLVQSQKQDTLQSEG